MKNSNLIEISTLDGSVLVSLEVVKFGSTFTVVGSVVANSAADPLLENLALDSVENFSNIWSTIATEVMAELQEKIDDLFQENDWYLI